MSHKHAPHHEKAVEIKYHGVSTPPQYFTPGAVGFDIAASEYVEVHPHKTVLIPTGLHVEIPQGYEIQIRPRSGFSVHHDIIIKNAPGTIDSDYRGEIKIIVYNLDAHKTVHIKKGDRIAQGVVAPVVQATFVEDKNHSETERGEKGFGSTGQ